MEKSLMVGIAGLVCVALGGIIIFAGRLIDSSLGYVAIPLSFIGIILCIVSPRFKKKPKTSAATK